MSLTVTPETTADEIAEAVTNLSRRAEVVYDAEVKAELRAEQDVLIEAWAARVRVER